MPYTTLISTAELAANLASGWAIVDCRYDLQDDAWGEDEYRASHIPGAVYASLSRHLSAKPDGTNGRHPLPARDSIAATFGELGISSGTQVVAYDQDAGMYASRLWWMLRYAGHRAVAVLDGGWARWRQEGHPTRSGSETRPASRFVPAWQSNWSLDVSDVVARYRDPHMLLLDARAAERFEGRVEPLDRIAGHIPGAVNRPYRANLSADNTMLPPEVLREQLLRDLDGHPPEEAVMYCGSGVSACHNLLALEHAGLPGARLYVGSWSEWSADPQRPVETGPSGRPA